MTIVMWGYGVSSMTSPPPPPPPTATPGPPELPQFPYVPPFVGSICPPRGLDLLDNAIALRWDQSGLNECFRAYWGDDGDRFSPLNDAVARPEIPFPYWVYDRTDPIPKGHSVGEHQDQEIKYEDVQIQFRVYAKPAGSRNAKQVVEDLMYEVASVFNPGTRLLNISPDRHLTTLSEGEWTLRVGDQEWLGIISLIIRMESTYNRGLTEIKRVLLPSETTPTGRITE